MRARALTAFLPVLATALATAIALTSASPANASTRHRLLAPFSREVVRPGAVDVDPYRIAHVYEVQYRLKWLGMFGATPNGHFGPFTERAVKRFQRHNHLRASGVVDANTWAPLIQQTIRGRRAVPHGCRDRGWHACYDRSRHQVNL